MKDSFEDQWKDALNDASQIPPPEIWDRVEAELEKKKRAGFLVWKNPFLLSSMAAALVLVLGILFYNSKDLRTLTQNKQGTPQSDKIGEDNASHQANEIGLSTKTLGNENDGVTRPALAVVSAEKFSRKKMTSSEMKSSVYSSMPQESSESILSVLTTSQKMEDNYGTIKEGNLEKLSGIQMEEYAVTFQKTAQYLEVNNSEAELISKKEKNGWFGVIASNAPFNPNFSTPGFQQQAASALVNSKDIFIQGGLNSNSPGNSGEYLNANRSDAQSNFRIGSAISYGVGFGKKLKKRFSIESGVRLTTAQTSHVYNVYTIDKITGEYNSFSLSNYALSSDLSEKDVLISVNGSSLVRYHFLSIPVLLNYNVLNLGKFNVNAVGGLSSEILLSGSVSHPKDTDQRFNAGDSNFRAINLAGLGGLKLSYSLTRHLDLNLGSTYQHFLNSGIESSTNASFKPSMLGINMGITVKR
jgi:hypothetical protein